MRRVKCEDCGKVYDFDTDDFCPRCGAFAFPKGDRIGADGTVIRVEGISESNHKGSFLHEEYHAENRHRKATGLDRGADRSRGLHWAPTQNGGKKGLSWAPGPSSPTAPRPASQARKSADTPEAEIKKVIGWLVGIFVLGSFFLQFLDILGNAGWSGRQNTPGSAAPGGVFGKGEPNSQRKTRRFRADYPYLKQGRSAA